MLQTRTVEPRTLELLKQLMALDEIKPFYLVGGTALALQLGHRASIDLDLFTVEQYDMEALINLLTKKYHLSIEYQEDQMLITYIDGIKVDFVKMSYPILFPPLYEDGVRMLDIRDIAAMKLKAITQRGSKKDFYDIFFLIRDYPLGDLLGFFKKKFTQYHIFHVIKSLYYFDDAEQYANPTVFDKKITWELVKKTVKNAVDELD